MIYTTLSRIRAQEPCQRGWAKLLHGLGKTTDDDEPLPYARIVEINGLDDALWATRAEPQYDKEWRLFAVWCGREALRHTEDWRSVYAVQIAERYAHGMATRDQLMAALAAAEAAARYAEWSPATTAALATTMDTGWRSAWPALIFTQTAKFLEIVG
jgi:hypothetical protein